jgi:hypothetical protein
MRRCILPQYLNPFSFSIYWQLSFCATRIKWILCLCFLFILTKNISFNYAFSQGPLVFDQLSTFISYVCHESPFKFSFLVVLIKIKINEGIVKKQEGQYLGLFLISITYTFWILPWTIMHVGWPRKAFESFPSINIETSVGKSKVLMWCPHFNVNFLIVPKITIDYTLLFFSNKPSQAFGDVCLFNYCNFMVYHFGLLSSTLCQIHYSQSLKLSLVLLFPIEWTLFNCGLIGLLCSRAHSYEAPTLSKLKLQSHFLWIL